MNNLFLYELILNDIEYDANKPVVSCDKVFAVAKQLYQNPSWNMLGIGSSTRIDNRSVSINTRGMMNDILLFIIIITHFTEFCGFEVSVQYTV